MRAAGHVLDDPALILRQGVGQQRDVVVTPRRLQAGELVVALDREPPRERVLAVGEHVDGEVPASPTARPVADCRLRQTSSIGGSSDSEETALAVDPCRRPSCAVVITVTPLAKWPMASRNASGVSCGACADIRSAA